MARTVADPAADTPALSGVKRIRDVTGAIAPLARASMLREPIYDAEQDHLSALWRLFADDQKALRTLAFIVRCSCAATVAYQLALSLQLPNALWAAMSALIVSQERLHETRSSLAGRILVPCSQWASPLRLTRLLAGSARTWGCRLQSR